MAAVECRPRCHAAGREEKPRSAWIQGVFHLCSNVEPRHPETVAGILQRGGTMENGWISAPLPAVEEKSTPRHTERPSETEARRPSAPLRWSVFARNFLRHPLSLGTVFPSSPALVRRSLAKVDWERCQTVIEYGPGVGHFTAALLERLPSAADLLALEINPEFVEVLRATLPDPRLQIIEASAGEVDRVRTETGLPPADAIISGLPFSTLPDREIRRIIKRTRDSLAPGGVFLVYQLSSAVEAYLREYFAEVTMEREWINLPPARIYACRTRKEGRGTGPLS